MVAAIRKPLRTTFPRIATALAVAVVVSGLLVVAFDIFDNTMFYPFPRFDFVVGDAAYYVNGVWQAGIFSLIYIVPMWVWLHWRRALNLKATLWMGSGAVVLILSLGLAVQGFALVMMLLDTRPWPDWWQIPAEILYNAARYGLAYALTGWLVWRIAYQLPQQRRESPPFLHDPSTRPTP